MMAPSPLLVVGTIVFVPATAKDSDGARETCIPETVISLVPGDKVWLPTIYWDAESGVIVDPSKTIIGSDCDVTTITGKVVGPIIRAKAEFVVIVDFSTTLTGNDCDISLTDTVLEPTIRAVADGASDMGVPETVIGEDPGFND